MNRLDLETIFHAMVYLIQVFKLTTPISLKFQLWSQLELRSAFHPPCAVVSFYPLTAYILSLNMSFALYFFASF